MYRFLAMAVAVGALKLKLRVGVAALISGLPPRLFPTRLHMQLFRLAISKYGSVFMVLLPQGKTYMLTM
jgi:hypothetical protein